MFEELVNKLFSTDPLLLKEQSIDLSFESEPPTREIGTDPMEPMPSTVPIIIKTTNINQLTNKPILHIQTMNQPQIQSTPTEYYNIQIESSSLTTDEYPMEDILSLTPSTSESPDEARSNSPDGSQENLYSTMLTNLDVN
jgi:hypothetical protein